MSDISTFEFAKQEDQMNVSNGWFRRVFMIRQGQVVGLRGGSNDPQRRMGWYKASRVA